MRILVTNDDGIDSIGLHVLARRLQEQCEVVVAAPDREYSGFGAALGTLETIQPEVHEADIEGVHEAWAVTGPPALCVFFGRLGVFGTFDLVVSGINPGVNTGRAIYHSGTVGAALTARNGGVPAIAVSQVVPDAVEGQGTSTADQHWDAAAECAARAAEALGRADAADGPVPVVNLNVPNAPIEDIDGWTFASVGTVPPRSIGTAALVPKPGHEGAYRVEMTWGDAVPLPEGTDGGAVERNLVALTYLAPFVHEARPDLDGIARALDGLWS